MDSDYKIPEDGTNAAIWLAAQAATYEATWRAEATATVWCDTEGLIRDAEEATQSAIQSAIA